MSGQQNPNLSGNASSSSAPTASSSGTTSTQGQATHHDEVGYPSARGLYAPNITGDVVPDDSIPHIVGRLMNPDEAVHDPVNDTLTLWITQGVGIIGNHHFEDSRVSSSEWRRVLQHSDPIIVQLQAEVDAGRLHREILEWLKGGAESLVLPDRVQQ